MAVLRRGILGVAILGTAAMTVELLLIGHYASSNQTIPLAVAALALVALVWVALAPSLVAIRLLQLAMLVTAGTGITGIALHFQSNVATLRHDEPALAGADLIWRVVTTPAPPALAPGVMVQIGLLGLLVSYRHPALHEEEYDDVPEGGR